MKVSLELQPCCWDRSGIGTYTYEICSRLRNTDELEFSGNLFNFCGRRDNSAALANIDMPIRTNRLFPYGVYRRVWNFLPLTYSMMFPGAADLSVFFNFIVPPRIKGRVITAVHDLTYLQYPDTMKRSNLEHMQKGIAYSVSRSDRIITVSEFSKREIMEQLGVPEEKISLVYNAPSLSGETADFGEVCRKYGIRGSYILCVGTIEPRKNLARLLRAFDLLKERRKLPQQLVLAGGKGWQDEDIYETARAINAADDVVFTGFVTQEEKNALYRHAELMVFPSVYEGFGIPPLEAMALGCPVVCSQAASLPEVVDDAALLVDPFSEESIAEGILRLLEDRAYAHGLIEKGYKRAAFFTWDASAAQFVGVCRETLR